jgi:hypothetical protein
MDVQLFVGSGVFVFGIWALKTIIGVQDVSDDEGCEEEYCEDVVSLNRVPCAFLVTNLSGSAVIYGTRALLKLTH